MPTPKEPTTPIEGLRRVRTVLEGGREHEIVDIDVDRPCAPYAAEPAQQPRCLENRGGDFYTDCASCLSCDVPHLCAGDLFAYVRHRDEGQWHCVFTRPPQTPEEIDGAIQAMVGSEVCGIRYGGSDPEILRRIRERGADCGVP